MKTLSQKSASARKSLTSCLEEANLFVNGFSVHESETAERCLSAYDYKNLPRNLRNINIKGDEPFLREDLAAIIKMISRQCPKAEINILTGGLFPSLIKNRMREIARFRADIGVAVVVYGMGKYHDRHKGAPGSYGLVLETLRFLKEINGRNLKIAFALNSRNSGQIRRVYELSQELGVGFELYLTRKDSYGLKGKLARQRLEWLVSRRLREFSGNSWHDAYFVAGLINFLATGQRVLRDYSGFDSVVISPCGGIYPSGGWRLSIGNLQTVSDWSRFNRRVRQAFLFERRPVIWTSETAAPAMRKHWWKVLQWALWEKSRRLISASRDKKERSSLFSEVSAK